MRIPICILTFILCCCTSVYTHASSSNDEIVAIQQGHNLIIKAKPFEFIRSCIHGDAMLQKETSVSYEDALVIENYYNPKRNANALRIKHIWLKNKGQAKDGPCVLDLLSYGSEIQDVSWREHQEITIGNWKIEINDQRTSLYFQNNPVSSVQ